MNRPLYHKAWLVSSWDDRQALLEHDAGNQGRVGHWEFEKAVISQRRRSHLLKYCPDVVLASFQVGKATPVSVQMWFSQQIRRGRERDPDVQLVNKIEKEDLRQHYLSKYYDCAHHLRALQSAHSYAE